MECFHLYNMKYILFFLLISNIYAQDKNINCSDGQCNSDFVPLEIFERPFYSVIDAGNNIDKIYVFKNANESPRSLRLNIESNTLINPPDLDINLSSDSTNYNAGDFFLTTDIVNKLSVKLDGFQGQKGKSTSELCAEKYLNEEFGIAAKQEFLAKRVFNTALPANKCEYVDVDYLQQNNFACDDSSFLEIDNLSPVVNVKRLKGKYRCLGLSVGDVCLNKTIEVSCLWKIKYLSPAQVAGTYSTSQNDWETKKFKISEKEYLEKSLTPGFNNYMCNIATSNEGEVLNNILQNGEFFINASNWNLTQTNWINKKIKFNGSINQTIRPTATQILNTQIGRRYRVKATLLKSEEDSWISTGRVNLFDSPAKTNLITNKEFYEIGAVGNIHFNSNPTYKHFGYLLPGTFSAIENFLITNEDDREATNCSAPYLQGNDGSFTITADNCGTNNLGIGQSCQVQIRANPNTIGRKTVYLKRNCVDSYGTSSTLNTKIEAQAYQQYQRNVVVTPKQGYTASNCVPSGTPETYPTYACDIVRSPRYSDNKWWKFDVNTQQWQYWGAINCPSNINCQINEDGFCFYTQYTGNFNTLTYFNCDEGYVNGNPDGGLFIGSVPTNVAKNPFPLPLKSSISLSNQKDFYDFDFIFTATSTQTLIELRPILRFHSGYFDNISVTEISPNAGPSIPPIDTNTANATGAEGVGYYDLAETSFAFTSPGYNSSTYKIENGSDWSIRYVAGGVSCPKYFEKIKTGHLSSHVSYDDNDNLCDDVYTKEDPANELIQWTNIGFERLPEFGTEIVQCAIDNCPVSNTVRNLDHQIVTLNTSDGISGTEQGEGYIFLYSIKDALNSEFSSKIGGAGEAGADDISKINSTRVCVKVNDVDSTGVDSEFAAEPSVSFRRYNWQAIRVENNSNFGNPPLNNGKKIKVYKKVDQSVRHLIKKELY